MIGGKSDSPFRRPASAIRAGRKALDVAQLCTLAPLPESILQEIDPALVQLLTQAEAGVRAQTALRLADCSWAPLETVRMLAFDEISVAEPVLARSPRLDDACLIDAAGRGRTQRRVIAGRNQVSARVSSAISAYREPDCLNVLAANPGAELGPASASDFAAGARGDETMQNLLASRSDLHPAIARAIYAIAGERVKRALATALPELDPGRIETVIDEGLEAALDHGEDGAAEALTGRLMARGVLGKADVLRAAKGGRSDIADHAVANLTGLNARDWRRALSRSPLRVCLLAARAMAMDIDEAAGFYAALAQVGRTHEMEPDALSQACDDIYNGFARDDARRALRRLGAGGAVH